MFGLSRVLASMAPLPQERMPPELAAARLVMSEKMISTRYPVPLHGVVDQVFELPNGVLVPLDTKKRGNPVIYWSDIAQLSVYRVILRRQARVAPYGYVRLVVGEQVRYVPVTLLPTDQIVAAWTRLAEGHVAP